MALTDAITFKIKVARKKSIPGISYKGKFKVTITPLGRFVANDGVELYMSCPFAVLSENPF